MQNDLKKNKVFLGRVSSVTAICLMALAPSVIKLSEMEIFRLIFWRLSDSKLFLSNSLYFR